MSAPRVATQPRGAPSLESRARQSRGTSSQRIYEMVGRVLERHAIAGGTFVDVGCGTGDLRRFLDNRFDRTLPFTVGDKEEIPRQHQIDDLSPPVRAD